MFENQRLRNIINLYKIKEILKRPSSKKNINEVKKIIKNGFKKLKYCVEQETLNCIEYASNGETSSSAFLWQEKLVAIYNISSTMLGILDARYDDYNRIINGNSSFSEKDQEILSAKQYQQEIIDFRNKVIDDYKKLDTRNTHDKINDIIKITAVDKKNIPLHTKFNILLDDMIHNHYNLSLQGEFITNYLTGYNNSLNFNYIEIMIFYNTMILQFDINNSRNKINIQKAAKLIK